MEEIWKAAREYSEAMGTEKEVESFNKLCQEVAKHEKTKGEISGNP